MLLIMGLSGRRPARLHGRCYAASPSFRASGASRWCWRALCVLVLPALVGGCTGEIAGHVSKSPAVVYRNSNLILILVDTLRADHLGAYGYGRKLSANLDALAASSVLFENAHSQASCTFPSVNSLLTSRYPGEFLRQPEGIGIPDNIASIAEILQDDGYTTLALSASPIVRKSPSWANRHGGFDRGFDSFNERCNNKDAGCIHEQLRRHLPDLREPFFLYLHYMEPHDPYRPPEHHARRYASNYIGSHDFIRRGEPNPIAEMLYNEGPSLDLHRDDIAHLVDLYDEEIAYFDSRFPEIQSMLESIGASGDTVIAVTSDHGEEFLEHDHIKHCRPLYETQIHVPLILQLPDGPSGLRIAEPVENLDLVPTLVDYLDVDVPAERFQGRSLRPLIEGLPAEVSEDARYAYSAQHRWRSVVGNRFKLLAEFEASRRPKKLELFDLIADRSESRNVADLYPDWVRRMSQILARRMRNAERNVDLEDFEDAHRRLRAVGYLQ